MRTVIEICQPERVSKACSIAGKISGVTSTNTPIPALHDLWRAGPFELVNSLHIQIQETPPLRRRSRPDPRRSRILRGAKATFGYGSTLTFLEDIAHVTHSRRGEETPRPRPRPSHQIDGSTIPARALTGAAAAECAIGAGQDRRHHHHQQSHPHHHIKHDRTGAEKTLVDLAATPDRGKTAMPGRGHRTL
jgi:hypothetical protein